MNIGTVYVCGIGTPDVLNQYQDDDLILDSKLRARGTKTGFYGFDYLKPVTGMTDIEKYRKNKGDTRTVRYAKEKASAEVKKCPECNRDMIIKNGKYGQFWGCTGFPKCRHAENI